MSDDGHEGPKVGEPEAGKPGDAEGDAPRAPQLDDAEGGEASAQTSAQTSIEAPKEASNEAKSEAPAPPKVPLPDIPPLRHVAAVLLGFGALAAVDMVMFATRRYGGTPVRVRAVAELVSAGYLLAMGVMIALLVGLYRRFGPRQRWLALVPITLLSWALGWSFYGEDLSGLSDSLVRYVPSHNVRMAILTFTLSLSVPAAIVILRWMARHWHWATGVALAVAALVANGMNHDYPEIHLFVSQSYPGVHLLVAVLAGLAMTISFERANLPFLERWMVSPRAKAAPVGLALWGALALGVLPSNAVLLDLERYPGAVLFPFLGKHHEDVRGNPNIPPGKEAWWRSRDAAPAVEPSKPSMLPEDAIVIVLGIDSMRADLLQDEKYRDDLPELFRLRDESTYFANARAAGSSTAPSLAALFSGMYYSQLYWSSTTLVDMSLVFPHEDTSKRFPELLQDAGVETVTSDGTGWLLSPLGIVRGFGDESSQKKVGYGYTKAQLLLNPVIQRLKTREKVREFYFIHMLDAHSPYTSAGKRSTPFLGYVAELSRVDKQIDRLVKALAQKKLLSRTVLIVMSDHGEAFGEHGTLRHAVSLYDELLKVPLMIRMPKKPGRVVTDPVSLIDVAPTILDLMGVPTPGRYMGESLTGYLRGQDPKLTRPIVAEARLKRAMVLPEGVKVIYDSKTQVVEIYDLTKDPKEENNLYREGDPVSADRLGVLTQFFDAHTLKRPGYKVPYRKW